MAKNRVYGEKMKKKNLGIRENSGIPMKKHKRNINSQKSFENSGSFFIRPSENKNEHVHLQPSNTSKPTTSEEKFSEIDSTSKVNSKLDSIRQKKEQNSEPIDKKKPFDKKLYRLKKYSKKYKLQQWEEKKKKTLLRDYQRSLKNLDEPKIDVAKIYEEDDLLSEEPETKIEADAANNSNTDSANHSKTDSANSHKKKKTFLKPHERYQQIKEDKQRKMEEIMRRKEEREAAIKKAKKARFEKNKKLSQKTKKGQPIMKYRMEMLLEQIEKSLKND